jgi:hypothetical protein
METETKRILRNYFDTFVIERINEKIEMINQHDLLMRNIEQVPYKLLFAYVLGNIDDLRYASIWYSRKNYIKLPYIDYYADRQGVNCFKYYNQSCYNCGIITFNFKKLLRRELTRRNYKIAILGRTNDLTNDDNIVIYGGYVY